MKIHSFLVIVFAQFLFVNLIYATTETSTTDETTTKTLAEATTETPGEITTETLEETTTETPDETTTETPGETTTTETPGETTTETPEETTTETPAETTTETLDETTTETPGETTTETLEETTTETPDETTTTTPIPATTRYPTQKPDIENAEFKFEINLKIEMHLNDFDETIFRAFMLNKLSDGQCGKGLCKNYEIVDIRNGSVFVDGILTVAAAQLVDGQNREETLNILDNVISNVTKSMYDNNTMTVTNTPEFAKLSSDVCKASGVTCPEGFYCESGSCRNKCEKISCGEHGTCESFQNNTIIKCRCTSDSYYNYQGTNCNDKSFKWEVLVGISVAVAFVIIMVIVIAFLCYCYKMRVKYPKGSSYAPSLTDAYGPDSSEMPLTNFNEKQEEGFEFYNNQRSKGGVINTALSPPDYDNGPLGRGFMHDNEGYTSQPLTSSFNANLSHIDPKADYTIKRPTFSVNPREKGTYEERL